MENTSTISGVNAGAASKKVALKRTFGQSFNFDELYLIPDVPRTEVYKYMAQLEKMGETIDGKDARVWPGLKDYVLTSSESFNSENKKILLRYVHTMISYAHKKGVDMEAAQEAIVQNKFQLGFIVYGQENKRTTLRKWQQTWELIKKDIFQTSHHGPVSLEK